RGVFDLIVLGGAALLAVLATAAGLMDRRRRRIERVRGALTSRYQAIFDQAQDSVIVADSATGLVVDANPAALAQLGYAAPQLYTLSLKTVLRGMRADSTVVDT